jgi:hypothetical protein
MSKRRKKIDPRQRTFQFSFQKKIETFAEATEDVQKAIEEGPPTCEVENEYEACIEIAAAIKMAIRPSGLSREQVVDAINDYFGRTSEGSKTDPPTCRRPLSINMFNNYLSKPTDYPIPAYYEYAIQAVTESMEPSSTILAARGATVASGKDLRHQTMGKIIGLKNEIRQLERQLNGKK